MALYTFQHPDTEEIIEINQGMSEDHFYVDETGVEWKRVWETPNMGTDSDSDIDPFSQKDFMRATEKKGMTLGDMQDLSKSLSKKREKSQGVDPVKNKSVTNYEKKCNKPHPNK